jgi:hypothetical protein
VYSLAYEISFPAMPFRKAMNGGRGIAAIEAQKLIIYHISPDST